MQRDKAQVMVKANAVDLKANNACHFFLVDNFIDKS